MAELKDAPELESGDLDRASLSLAIPTIYNYYKKLFSYDTKSNI